MKQATYAQALRALEPIYRALTKNDVEEYRALRLKALKTAGHWYTASLEEEAGQSLVEWEAVCTETANRITLGAFLDDRLVGTTIIEAKDNNTVKWKSTYIEPRLRGIGIAEKLFELCEQWCDEHGFDAAVFTIRTDNLHMRTLQEEAGAVIIDEESMRFADGTVANVYWYKKELNAIQPLQKQLAS